ncbi:MAG: hypothetical protein V3S01_05430 [Dehalococcoidia bacterium]
MRASVSNRYYVRAPSGKLIQDRKREYRETYQAQLQAIHRVLLEGERLELP